MYMIYKEISILNLLLSLSISKITLGMSKIRCTSFAKKKVNWVKKNQVASSSTNLNYGISLLHLLDFSDLPRTMHEPVSVFSCLKVNIDLIKIPDSLQGQYNTEMKKIQQHEDRIAFFWAQTRNDFVIHPRLSLLKNLNFPSGNFLQTYYLSALVTCRHTSKGVIPGD